MIRPRICWFPEYRSSAGDEAVEMAASAGLRLDGWQQFVLRHSLGEKPGGRWAASTVGLVVGRQNGKNVILEARELVGAFLFEEKTIVHSAHEQATSSEHFRRMLERIEGVPEFDRRVLKVSRGKGAEAIELRGRQRILFKTRTGGGGRGFTADLVVFDEAMILSAAAKSSLIPTLSGRSVDGNLQIWYAGSAVDQLNPKHDGLELSRIRANGIRQHPNVAYFEWSVDAENPLALLPETAADPAMWSQANPGLGVRISEEWVEHERTVELGPREFAVERLGVGDWPDPDGTGVSVIDMETWRRLADETSSVADPVCLAFDVSPDRSMAAIGVAGVRPDGLAHVEVIDHRAGTGWLVDRLAGLVETHRPVAVGCSGAGPGASLVPALERAGVDVALTSAKEDAAACGVFYDTVDQLGLRHLGTTELAMAVRGAAKRPLSDAWAWSRKNSRVDITPLVSVTVALWLAKTATAAEAFVMSW